MLVLAVLDLAAQWLSAMIGTSSSLARRLEVVVIRVSSCTRFSVRLP